MRCQRIRVDQAHQQCCRIEDRHLKGEDAGDRQAEPEQAAKARPVGPPEAAEQAIAEELLLQHHHGRQAGKHQRARKRGGEARAGNAHGANAETAEHEHPVEEGVAGNRHENDDQRPARPLQRRDEGAQHDIAIEGQHRPLQPVQVNAGLMREPRLLAHG